MSRTHSSTFETATSPRLELVRTWLMSKHPELTEVPLDLDILESGLVNSVSFVEYVLVIEDAAGVEIEMNEGLIDKVRTLVGVQRHFMTETAPNQLDSTG